MFKLKNYLFLENRKLPNKNANTILYWHFTYNYKFGIDFVFPSKLRFEKQNPKRIISSKLDYSFGVLFYS